MNTERTRDAASPCTPAGLSLAVVIPVYNGRSHLAETLRSCLDQTYPAHEILVVEDGSPKPSRDIVEQLPGIRYVSKANGGVSSTRNYGASLATAEWICFLDQDDLLLPDHLEQICDAIRRDVHADLFYAPRLVLKCNEGVWTTCAAAPPPDPQDLSRVLPLRCPFPPSGICIRRSTFEKIGGFHSRYDLAEDWEFWLRLHATGATFHRLQRSTICYRVHMESNSHRPLPILHANVRVIRERILPSMMFLQRISAGQQLISVQEADAAILLRQMGQEGGPSLLLRSILRFPVGNWRRYKIAAHMSTQILKHVFTRDTAGSRA